jgi:murein DD-endopeptidase MepM/ murein hydrolase activator NlpD
VVKVEDDELMGTTVFIEHAGGYTTQYSSLQADPPVRQGQTVVAGDIIGTVGNTAAAENNMGPHLHFSVSKDGKVIDPAEYVG